MMKGRERRLDHPPSPLLDSSLALFLRMLLFLLLHPHTPLSLQKVYYSRFRSLSLPLRPALAAHFPLSHPLFGRCRNFVSRSDSPPTDIWKLFCGQLLLPLRTYPAREFPYHRYFPPLTHTERLRECGWAVSGEGREV